jgi:hypothetical protein
VGLGGAGHGPWAGVRRRRDAAVASNLGLKFTNAACWLLRPGLQRTGPGAAPWGLPQGWAWAAPLPWAAAGSRWVRVLAVGLGRLLCRASGSGGGAIASLAMLLAAQHIAQTNHSFWMLPVMLLPPADQQPRETRDGPPNVRREGLATSPAARRPPPAACCGARRQAGCTGALLQAPRICCCCFYCPFNLLACAPNLPSWCRCLIASVLFGGAMGYRAGSNP